MVLPRGGILSFEGRGNIVFSELIDRTWATLVLPGSVPGRVNNIPTGPLLKLSLHQIQGC